MQRQTVKGKHQISSGTIHPEKINAFHYEAGKDGVLLQESLDTELRNFPHDEDHPLLHFLKSIEQHHSEKNSLSRVIGKEFFFLEINLFRIIVITFIITHILKKQTIMKNLLFLSAIILLASCSSGVKPVENTPTAKLGEGAIWHPEKEALLWVDITGGKVFMYNPNEGMLQDISLESMVGTVVPSKGEYFAVTAQETGIFGLREDGTQQQIAAFPSDALPNVRFNDGKCDPAGRFWVGTMEKTAKEGAAKLYMFDNDSLFIKETNVTISNGIVWDSNKKLMYYIDTPTQQVVAYNYDPETGDISNKRVVVQVPKEMGSPDGMSIDTEGKLWIAHWGGSGVYRWNPETGDLMEKIDVPAPNVTSCAFGGPNLTTLYITTAREGLTDEQLEKYPLSGSLFVTETAIKGTPANLFR